MVEHWELGVYNREEHEQVSMYHRMPRVLNEYLGLPDFHCDVASRYSPCLRDCRAWYERETCRLSCLSL